MKTTNTALPLDIQVQTESKPAQVLPIQSLAAKKDQKRMKSLIAQLKMLAEDKDGDIAPLTKEELIDRFRTYSESPKKATDRVMYLDHQTGKVTSMTKAEADRRDSGEVAEVVSISRT